MNIYLNLIANNFLQVRILKDCDVMSASFEDAVCMNPNMSKFLLYLEN